MRGRSDPPRDVDDYLGALPAEVRAALEKLRTDIKAAAPDAVEIISYQIPTFKLDGRPLISFGAATKHCALYVMSPEVTAAHAAELEGYKLGKGSVQFQVDRPLPAALVKKLVKARIAENQARWSRGS